MAVRLVVVVGKVGVCRGYWHIFGFCFVALDAWSCLHVFVRCLYVPVSVCSCLFADNMLS